MTRVAIYARVSTEGQSVDQQLYRLRSLAPGADEYADSGVSGRLDSRPEFDRLREQIRRGAISDLFVVKLDRLGRSAHAVLEFFELAEAPRHKGRGRRPADRHVDSRRSTG
ncbi:protein containing Resolvase [mine drainage metagenome]|uniref:Protein containing Resolvase n=1 Tax=mine drainage metagenome TaxID=410659 RepID=T0Y9W3_9ZZZZ